jgi:predicted nucleic acid-binding Zn ribbon protein
MICPECSGNGFILLPGESDPWETSQNPFANEREVNCPTCEGQGKLSDNSATNHCQACGEPLKADQVWCDDHQGAALTGNNQSRRDDRHFHSSFFQLAMVPCNPGQHSY